MNVWMALVVFAVLFAVFGLGRRRACGGDCSHCGQTCERRNETPSR